MINNVFGNNENAQKPPVESTTANIDSLIGQVFPGQPQTGSPQQGRPQQPQQPQQPQRPQQPQQPQQPINNQNPINTGNNVGNQNLPNSNNDDCECVPYYQCQNGTILDDGVGLIDIR